MTLWLLLFSASSVWAATTELTPQYIVDRILNKGRAAQEINTEAKKAYTDYYATYGLYDWTLSGKASYEDSRIQYLSGAGNIQDKTSIWTVGMSKRVPTGTTIGLNFTRTIQNSTFRTTSSSSRSPYIVYDLGELVITQDILGNFFGIAERKNRQVADQILVISDLSKREKLEGLVLSTLQSFWNAYVAKESLKEAISQRDKYEDLVKEVRNKARFGFVNPGDLPKAQAEFGAQVRNVKSASFEYLRQLDSLLTDMRFEESDREVELKVSEEIPPVPKLEMPLVEDLRSVTGFRLLAESAELTKTATNLATSFPELTLEGRAGFTGLDSTQGKSFAGLTSFDHPKYSIALLMSYKFFSDEYKSKQNRDMVIYEQAVIALEKERESIREEISTSMERVRYTYAAARSAKEELEHWSKAVQAQERSYKQGRLDFSQLIQDYNSYFRSRIVRIRALGDYHIALHMYAASIDQLVK
ncbi:MAG: TolC family protein [Oligoflexia bacterium]|nr:TolC family protein [Oligoflexia bacterium]